MTTARRLSRPSNHGYAHRYVTAILVDKNDPDTLFVGVVNDREWGGVFSYRYARKRLGAASSTGLGGRDVFTVKQASDGALIAGTNGEFSYSITRPANGDQAIPSSTVRRSTSAKPKKGTKAVAKPPATGVLDARVNEIDVTPQRWLAATSVGLFTSSNEGKSWSGGPVLGKNDFVSVQSDGELVVAATRGEVVFSTNGGTTWQQAALPANVSVIRGVTVTPDAQIMVASREGAFRSYR